MINMMHRQGDEIDDANMTLSLQTDRLEKQKGRVSMTRKERARARARAKGRGEGEGAGTHQDTGRGRTEEETRTRTRISGISHREDDSLWPIKMRPS